MRFLVSTAIPLTFLLGEVGLFAQAPVIRAVVNDSSPDGRLCPGCYGTVHFTPRGLGFTASSVSVMVNGQSASVNPGGASDDILTNSIRILLPSKLSPGPVSVVMITTDFGETEPFTVTLDAYSPGLSRLDQNLQCKPSLVAKPGDLISVVATGLGIGDTKPSLLVSGKPAAILPDSPNGNLTIGETRLTFRAPQEEGYHQVALMIGSKTSNTLMLPVGGAMLTVSGASLFPGPASPESIVTGISCGPRFGSLVAADGTNPPTTLGSTIVRVRDAGGVERLAPILAAFDAQVNYIVPGGTSNGLATVTATASDGSSVSSDLDIRSVAPGLFGWANLVRLSNGVQTVQMLEVPISAVGGDGIAGQPGSAAIDMGPETDQLSLVLFGTGIRQRSSLSNVIVDIGGELAPVQDANAQGTFIGLDQVTVRLPRSLAHRGDLDLRLTVDGRSANLAHLSFY